MNQVIETLMNHRSIRDYKEEGIPNEYVELVVKAAQAAPSSINGQQISIVLIKNKETKKKIAALCGEQSWIDKAPIFMLFVADYYRAKIAAEINNEKLVITDSLESIMVSSVDVGLAMGNAIAVAESLGLGTVPIGAVRREPKDIIELLELPEFVFPVAGLVIGYANDVSALKPRLPMAAVLHHEKYDKNLDELIGQYDETMSTYMLNRTGGKDNRNWSQTVSGIYNKVYFPKVSPTIKEQGFKNE